MNTRAKKFLSFYRPYIGLFLADMACAMIVAGVSLLNPLIVRYITNTILPHYPIDQAFGMIVKIAVACIGLAILQCVCNYFISYQGHMMGAKMEFDMRNELFAHFQKLSFNFFDNEKVGQLMSRVTNDLFDITELCHHGPEDVIISLIKFIGAFIILLNVNVGLTLIVFAFVPIMFAFTMVIRKRMRHAFKQNRITIAGVNALIEDNLSGIRVVKSFANEQLEVKKFSEGNTQFLQSKRDSYINMARFHSGLNLCIALLNIVVVVGGACFIAKGWLKLGDLLLYLLYVNNLIEPIQKLINFTEQYQNGITGFERFMEIIETKPDIVDRKNAVALSKVCGDITFENVAFQYQDTKDVVFRDISISVKAGEYLALVGSSGVGKTTMCSLIPRFYEVSQGAIRIDGTDIRDVTLQSLRDHIGVVQQDVYLFAGTVLENIQYGKLGATREEVIEAAKNANAHQFIMELPDGYDTYVGQRGIKLSGGQKQRLSIARVFLKNPPILIFDEATSALDNESERVVQESLEKLAANRTTIVIAHRLSTIRNAKRIIVLTENGIAEEGSHEELMNRNGIYRSLYEIAAR